MRKLLLFLLVLICNKAFSQDVGSISGTVTEKESGEFLTGVSVIIKDKAASVTTTNQGFFYFQNIKPGRIILLISHIGYQTVELSVQVIEGENIKVDVALITAHLIADEVVISASNGLKRSPLHLHLFI
jgi:hypothetical protein